MESFFERFQGRACDEGVWKGIPQRNYSMWKGSVSCVGLSALYEEFQGVASGTWVEGLHKYHVGRNGRLAVEDLPNLDQIITSQTSFDGVKIKSGEALGVGQVFHTSDVGCPAALGRFQFPGITNVACIPEYR